MLSGKVVIVGFFGHLNGNTKACDQNCKSNGLFSHTEFKSSQSSHRVKGDSNLKPKVIGHIPTALFGAVANKENSKWENQQPHNSLYTKSLIA